MVQISPGLPPTSSPLAGLPRGGPRAESEVTPTQEAITVSLSPEAQSLLDSLAADPGAASPAAAAAGLRQRLKAQAARMDPLKRHGGDPGQRISDIQDQLAGLLKRLQQAALLGDKRAAAAIAKEAGGLAKELASAVKDAAGAARDGASGTTQAPAASPDPATADLAAQAAARLSPVDPGLQQQVARALVTLRALVGTAKAAVRRKDSAGRIDSQAAAGFRKQVAEAEKALAEAETAIQADLGPAGSGSRGDLPGA
jgi:hypothetical protein